MIVINFVRACDLLNCQDVWVVGVIDRAKSNDMFYKWIAAGVIVYVPRVSAKCIIIGLSVTADIFVRISNDEFGRVACQSVGISAVTPGGDNMPAC